MNIGIFEDYWEEKLYWQDLRTGVGGHWMDQTSFNFSDYMEYGPTNIKDIILPYIYRKDNLFLLLLLLSSVLFTCYIALPIIMILLKKINQKIVFIVIDSIILSIYLLCTFPRVLYYPMIGVIPMCILISMAFFILLFFRIYQYKKKLIF